MLLSEMHVHAYGLSLASFQGCGGEKQPGIDYLCLPDIPPKKHGNQLLVKPIHTFSISPYHRKIDVF